MRQASVDLHQREAGLVSTPGSRTRTRREHHTHLKGSCYTKSPQSHVELHRVIQQRVAATDHDGDWTELAQQVIASIHRAQ